MTYRYESLASDLEGAIRKGVFPIGARLPSIRQTCRQHGVSMATVIEAYARLEDQGLIEPRAKSGFFVKRPVDVESVIAPSRPRQQPGEVSVSKLAMEVLAATTQPGVAPLGAGVPNSETLPVADLARCLSRAARVNQTKLAQYEQPRGNPLLRDAVSHLLVQMGCPQAADDIVITNGAQEALMLALRATTRVDDVVAVESPVYFGILQVLEALGLRALELSTHPRNGIDLDALEGAARKGTIRACVLTPTYQNPLGFRMADRDKQYAVEILARYGVTLIEDDVFGGLGLEYPWPRPAKSFDTAEGLILCGSFSKTVSPAMRLGWLASARFADAIVQQKFLLNLSSATVEQLAMAEFLKGNRYRRATQGAAKKYTQRLRTLREAVIDSFPSGTTCSTPLGGFFLWVEMPSGYDTMALYQRALDDGISLSPGRLFARGDSYRSSFRLSVAAIRDDHIPGVVTRLANLARSCKTQ